MRLRVHQGPDQGREYRLGVGANVVGRDPGCQVALLDDQVSRQHAELLLDPSGEVVLRDLASTNGTFVNGEPIHFAPLYGDEELRFGNTVASLSRLGASEQPVSRSSMPWHVLIPAGSLVLVLLLVLVFVVARDARQLSRGEVVDRVRPSVVMITDGTVAGSGWVFDANEGLVVTNAHVVEGGGTFTVGYGSDRRAATILAVSPCEDLAILRVADTSGFRTLGLGSQEDLSQGDEVLALGFPGSLANTSQLTVTSGSVSVVEVRVDPFVNLIQTDAAINPGNSGGPLVDMEARLVGVNVGKTLGEGIEGQGYAIGVDRVKEVISQMVEGADVCLAS